MSLHIPDHVDFNFPATGKFNIEFDYKTSLTGSSDAIFRKLNSFLFRRVYNENAQCYSFSILTLLAEPQIYSFPIIAGTKYHIKIEYDNSRYELYVDTIKLEPESYQDNTILESNDGFIFGYSHPVNSRFRIKDIKINEEVVMSVTKVSIPYNESNLEKRLGWEREISTILATGADVQFVDDIDDTVERNIAQIGLFNETSGTVKARGVGMTDAQATTKSFAAGGYHLEAISYIYASGTDSSLGIHVRMA